MRLGIITPVVNLNPRFDPPPWEVDGGIDDIVAVAQAAEALGYDWVGCPEHVAIPERAAAARGGRYWDPVATLSFVAARTTSIGLLPHVTVLGYHHPLELVKRYGTLDVASGGRLILGVGVGSLKPEFELLGAEFDGRGAIADEALQVIRSAFGQRTTSHDGTHFSYRDMIVEPSGTRRDLPIWVGGRTKRSLRRALELGDGWIPFGLARDDLAELLRDRRVTERIQRSDRPFEIVLAPEPPFDALDDPAGATATLRAYAELGATALAVRVQHRTRDHYVDQLSAVRELVDRELAS